MLEMVAVAIILAILATMVVQQVSGNILEARVRTAIAELRNIGNAIEIYAMKDPNANFPANYAALSNLASQGLLRELGKDPWGQDWGYCAPNRTTDMNGAIYSLGPNGKGSMTCPTVAGNDPVPSGDTATYKLYYIIRPKP